MMTMNLLTSTALAISLSALVGMGINTSAEDTVKIIEGNTSQTITYDPNHADVNNVLDEVY